MCTGLFALANSRDFHLLWLGFICGGLVGFRIVVVVMCAVLLCLGCLCVYFACGGFAYCRRFDCFRMFVGLCACVPGFVVCWCV